MGFSLAVRNAFLGHYFGKSTLTPPANYYVALIKADDSEPVGGSYARVSTAPADWNSPAAGAVDNAVAITFPSPTGTWGSITKVKLFDAAAAGNELAVGDLPYARDVTAVSPAPVFAVGNIRAVLT